MTAPRPAGYQLRRSPSGVIRWLESPTVSTTRTDSGAPAEALDHRLVLREVAEHLDLSQVVIHRDVESVVVRCRYCSRGI